MTTCEWWSLRSALAHFVTFSGSTQSQRHIKPLHWYVACRLVVEGGFDPDEIVPRPPFRVTRKGKRLVLVHGPRRLRAENPVVKDRTSWFNQAPVEQVVQACSTFWS